MLENSWVASCFSTITAVNVTPSHVSVVYQLPDGFDLLNDNGKSTLIALRDKYALFGDVKLIRSYHKELLFYADKGEHKFELHAFVQHMLEQAYRNSSSSDAATHNHAALMALVLYFGHDKFEMLVGNVSSLTPKQRLIRYKMQGRVHINRRPDLQKHFVYSMALQMFGNKTTSDTLGELKELLDANVGGSGFSFADLMADRAGTQFAKLATRDNTSAERIQQAFIDKEIIHLLLPEEVDLPEQISAKEFERIYQNVKAKEYLAMVKLIDDELAGLQIYQ